MSKFAPKYFEYMSNSMSSKVRIRHLSMKLLADDILASYLTGQDLWFLQDRVQEPDAWKDCPYDAIGHGKSLPRPRILPGLCAPF